MILNKDRTRAYVRKWKYSILTATLIAMVAWILIPARLVKPGLAQQAGGDLDELLAKYMGDSRNFDDLVETVLTSRDPEARQKAFFRLHILEGDGSTAALVKLYSKSKDPAIKRMVIHSLVKRGAGEQLATIAETEQSPEFRQMANEAIKDMKENTYKVEVTPDSELIPLSFRVIEDGQSDVTIYNAIGKPIALVTNGAPPPPPPPSEVMTVMAGRELKPLVGNRGESVYDLLREAADANMRRDTAFFERVLDDNFVGIGPDGEARNKAETIAEVKRLDYTFKKYEFDDLNVSGDERSSFATFLVTVYFQINGQDSTAQFRETVNFIKRDGQLKIAAIHMTQKQ